jgi:hypothetical protein
MSKWLDKFLRKDHQNRTDNTDRFDSKVNVSVLSVPPVGPFDKNLGNMSGVRTDSTDRLDPKVNMSVLSVPSMGLFAKNLENKAGIRTDRTDRFDPKMNMSVLSVPSEGPFGKFSLLDDFEERLAITEYEGHRTSTQAQRIAYQDAFVEVLSTLPYEEEGYYDEDWLTRRIKAAQNWLAAQGLQQPK